jgi:hypothetical protein
MGSFCFAREEITRSKFNTMIGLVDRERVDAALYDDFESAKAREVYYHLQILLVGPLLAEQGLGTY